MNLSAFNKAKRENHPQPPRLAEYEFVKDKNVISADEFVEEPEDNVEGNPFLYSLEMLTPDDIAPPPPKTRMDIGEAIRVVTLFICIAVFVGSLFYILRTLYFYRRAQEIYGGVKLELDIDEIFADPEAAVRPAAQSSQSPATADFITSMAMTDEDYEKISQAGSVNKRVALVKASLNAWKLQNKDVYGYIKIPGTKVDDIVVQTEDNDYYLNHSWKGDYLPNGAIYVDYRCHKNILKNYNTILYGHHMNDGTMFNTLDYFFEEEFFNNNKYIEIYTFDGIFTYEVFAVYITDMYYHYIRTAFPSGEEFVKFAYEMKENSIHQREGIEFTENDRIITLSTCTNRIQTERIAVQAKLVKVER